MALTLPGAQLHCQHGRPSELLAPALVPANGCTQFPLQLTQVLRSETWGMKGPVRRAGDLRVAVARRGLWGWGHSPGGAGV